MTLDEAIDHAREVAAGCGPCAQDHADLTAYLEELRDRRAGRAWLVCAGCGVGTPEVEATARGWRSQTSDGPDDYPVLCRECQDDGTGREVEW